MGSTGDDLNGRCKTVCVEGNHRQSTDGRRNVSACRGLHAEACRGDFFVGCPAAGRRPECFCRAKKRDALLADDWHDDHAQHCRFRLEKELHYTSGDVFRRVRRLDGHGNHSGQADGKLRLGDGIDDGGHTLLQARLPLRHRHRRNNRQPIQLAAHHFHRHAAEKG